MRPRLLTAPVVTFLILSSFAQGQFLRLPQYDNGVSFGRFFQVDINLDGKTDIVRIRAVRSGSIGETKAGWHQPPAHVRCKSA